MSHNNNSQRVQIKARQIFIAGILKDASYPPYPTAPPLPRPLFTEAYVNLSLGPLQPARISKYLAANA